MYRWISEESNAVIAGEASLARALREEREEKNKSKIKKDLVSRCFLY